MHHDAAGYLLGSRRMAEVPPSSSEAPAVAMSVARWRASELCSMAVAQIPWQTPWTYGEGDEIRLEPMAEERFQKEVLKRATLAAEVRAKAGESRFAAKQTLHGQWELAQRAEIQSWAEGEDKT